MKTTQLKIKESEMIRLNITNWEKTLPINVKYLENPLWYVLYLQNKKNFYILNVSSVTIFLFEICFKEYKSQKINEHQSDLTLQQPNVLNDQLIDPITVFLNRQLFRQSNHSLIRFWRRKNPSSGYHNWYLGGLWSFSSVGHLARWFDWAIEKMIDVYSLRALYIFS